MSSSALPPRPILVRLPNWLGDLIQALPVVSAAAGNPSRRAILVGPAGFGPLLTPRFPSAEFIPWSRARRFAAAGALRRARPGTALLLTDSLSSAILAAVALIPERIGYAAELRGALLTRRVPRSGPSRTGPRVEEYAALGRAAGLLVGAAVPRLTALPEELRTAGELLQGVGLAGASYAVLAPGASYGPAKRWNPERFAAVATHLATRFGLTSILVGTQEDVAAAAETERMAGGFVRNLTRATNLSALTGLLGGARLVVSNDSGVMHLGAALGRPTVAVFGSTSPVWSAADAPWVRNLYAAYPCSPCFRRTCPIGYGCLRSIGPEQAIQAADDLLAADP